MVIDNLSVSKLIRMFYIMPTPQFLFILCVSVIMYLLIERLIKRFKYHNIDEFANLFNILRGEMSFMCLM